MATQPASIGMKQLTLDAGGATVDTSRLGSISWGAVTRDLDGQFRKGDDITITLTARVTAVEVEDKYDAHGNITETIRRHSLRVDDQRSKIKTAAAYEDDLEKDEGDGEA